MNNRLVALALETFAIGTGSFVFAGLLEGVAEDLSVSVATAGHLVTVFALSLNASVTPGSRRRGSPEPPRRW